MKRIHVNAPKDVVFKVAQLVAERLGGKWEVSRHNDNANRVCIFNMATGGIEGDFAIVSEPLDFEVLPTEEIADQVFRQFLLSRLGVEE